VPTGCIGAVLSRTFPPVLGTYGFTAGFTPSVGCRVGVSRITWRAVDRRLCKPGLLVPLDGSYGVGRRRETNCRKKITPQAARRAS
jgi:hypothetical protein